MLDHKTVASLDYLLCNVYPELGRKKRRKLLDVIKEYVPQDQLQEVITKLSCPKFNHAALAAAMAFSQLTSTKS